MNRTCSKCKTTHELSTEHFYRNKNGKEGFVTWCKRCSDNAVSNWLRAKEARQLHSAHCKAYMARRREYHYKHLDELRPCLDCHEVKALREYTPCHSVCRPCDRVRRNKARARA